MADSENSGTTINVPSAAVDVQLFYALHEPLGALVMEFAELEAKVTSAINLLLRIDEREGTILEALMPNFAMRIELFHALAMIHLRHPNLEKEVTKIASSLHTANGIRNNLLHNEWTAVSLSPTRTFGKNRSKAQSGKIRPITDVHDVSVDDAWDAVDYTFAVKQRIERWEICFRRPIPETWPAPMSDTISHSPRRKASIDKEKKQMPKQSSETKRIGVNKISVSLSDTKTTLTIAFGGVMI